MTYDEMIAVIQAAKDGKTIQMETGGRWYNLDKPKFNFLDNKYRVKPEPREWFVYENLGDGGNISSHCVHNHNPKPIRVREVLED